MTPKAVLDLPLGPNDSGAATIREYLKALLTELWTEVEGFSGKRPFGNSGWQSDVYQALVKFEVVKGALDEEGYLEELDRTAARVLMLAVIKEL